MRRGAPRAGDAFEAAAVLSHGDLVTVILLVGHHMMVARLLATLDVELDPAPAVGRRSTKAGTGSRQNLHEERHMNANDTDPAARPINMVRTGPRGGTPVILIHPVGLELSYWGMQIEALRGTHDVAAFDLPGHGRTPGSPADGTLQGCPRPGAGHPLDRMTKTLLADDPQVHAAMWDMISALDLVPQLHRITCPTLILVGEFDPSLPAAAARVLLENIAGAQMHVIAQASHMAPLEKPAEVNAHLVRFLAAVA